MARKRTSTDSGLTLTTQTRLVLSEAESQVLDAFAVYQGTLKRKLYACVASKGGKAIDHKTEFCRKHQLSSRLFNALRIELQGNIDGVRERLKTHLKESKKALKSTQKKCERLDNKFKTIASGVLRVKKPSYLALCRQRTKAKARVQRLEKRINSFTERLASAVPGIGFGSRALFKKQYHLEANGYANHAEWYQDWTAARNHQIVFLGSKDEAGGNQQCTLSLGKDDTFDLRVRLPDTLCVSKEEKYLWLRGLEFKFQHQELVSAIARNQALTWHLHRDTRGWRALVSFARPDAKQITAEIAYGALGVDFNADHLAVTETDPCGNLRQSWRFDFESSSELTSGQRKASLSDALSQVVALAIKNKLPIVVEDLDFTQKKQQLSEMNKNQARMLSGLAYNQYQQLLESKCRKQGIALHKVNPAYTSVIGRIKYASSRGKSVHTAAAGVIARRGMGLRETLPRAGTIKVPAKGVTCAFPVPARKAGTTQRTMWQDLSLLLGKCLREQRLATSRYCRQDKGRQVRKAGSTVGVGSFLGNHLAETIVRSANTNPISDDQVCVGFK